MNRFGKRIRTSSFNRQTHFSNDELQSVPTATKEQIRVGISSHRFTRAQASSIYDLPLSVIDSLMR